MLTQPTFEQHVTAGSTLIIAPIAHDERSTVSTAPRQQLRVRWLLTPQGLQIGWEMTERDDDE